ncbi:hypothetical protein F1880_005151 [Penicillium rolfsii]|nr:hypothetical protein F1880_005151 [Penicillium rolfsii]
MPPYNQPERITSSFSLEDYLVAEIPKRKIALSLYSIDHDVTFLQEAVSQTAAAFFAGEGNIKTSLFRTRGVHPLEKLATILLRQFYNWGKTELLEVAIDKVQMYSAQQSPDAVDASPSFRTGLGTLLLIRYEHGRRKEDLAGALSNVEDAIASDVEEEHDREYPKRLFAS